LSAVAAVISYTATDRLGETPIPFEISHLYAPTSEKISMADYVLVINLGDAAGTQQYMALKHLMHEFGFIMRGPETLRPVQFSVTTALPLRGIKRMVEGRIKAELLPEVIVDAYEIKQLLHCKTAPLPHRRRFH
jgi:hypothetical protein